MEKQTPTLIIGAGVAGLAAARELRRAGLDSILLEARERIGGRIHTITSPAGEYPIELGAEFIHGEENQTWEVLRAAKLRTKEIPDRHWDARRGKLVEDHSFWDRLEEVTRRFNDAAPDQDLQSFLDEAWGLNPRSKQYAREYVEGFHAARVNEIGIHALAKAEAAAEREGGTHQFRLKRGYAGMLRWFAQESAARGATVHLRTVVEHIRWEPGHVQVQARTPDGQVEYQAACAIVTLPLGVLQKHIDIFEPKLAAKNRAIRNLKMGQVVKLTLQFRKRFWPAKNFGFIHFAEGNYPTWWADGRGPLLTAWAGGPRAESLAGKSEEELLDCAFADLSVLFKVEAARIRELFATGFTHDWSHDPFALGAYSFSPVNMSQIPRQLAAPVAQTLFFAGEATDQEGNQGTVHGALASGKRAAQEILQRMHVARQP